MTNLSGKVVVDDGAPIASRVLIQSNCHGVVKTEGYTDSKGAFSIQFSNKEFGGGSLASETPATHLDPNAVRQNSARDWRDCELTAVLPGFVSQPVDLGVRTPAIGNTNIGTIVLHHAATVEGATTSATRVSVPDKARKDYEKGLAEKKKSKLDSAQGSFQKAVEAYPDYAEAWLELGRVQAQNNDAAGARQSFHRSISADPKFVSPYRELAQLAGRDKQWQELADTTGSTAQARWREFSRGLVLQLRGQVSSGECRRRGKQRSAGHKYRHRTPRSETGVRTRHHPGSKG